MKVKDAMHRTATWVPAEMSLPEVAARMRDQDIGAVPVGEKDRLIGMVTDRDIAIRAFDSGRDPAKLKARDIMSKGIVYCRDSEELDDAVRLMENKQIRRLPVLDEKKRMVGMLSLGDLAHSASGQLVCEAMTAVSAHHA
jgi:CBS domain-containing protein